MFISLVMSYSAQGTQWARIATGAPFTKNKKIRCMTPLLLLPFASLLPLLSEICQNTFHTNRYFSVFKASFDVLDKPKQLRFCEISSASPVLSLSNCSQHAFSCAPQDLS